MKLKSIEALKPFADAARWSLVVLTAPVWAVLVAGVWLTTTIERLLDPPGWRRVFALWPVECDPWPDDGYSGWVWLETVWRNPQAPGWTKYRREMPTLDTTPTT